MAERAAAILRSDPPFTKPTTTLDALRSPYRSTTPGRPSISPLSNAALPSPKASRDMAMNDSAQDEVAAMPGHADLNSADVGDVADDRSSSLSEPEYDQDDDAPYNHVITNTATAEELTAHQSLEVDSEAETERLDQTPHKMRKHADSIGKTPSKLAQSAAADDDLSDPPSPLPMGPGGASSTSTVATAVGQKRKRSNSAESSLTSADSDELAESPRKRSHASSTHDPPAETEAPEADPAENPIESAADAVVEQPQTAEEPPRIATAPARGGPKGKKGKAKGKAKKEPVQEPVKEREVEQLEPPEAPQEQSDEAAARAADELKHKEKAAADYEALAKHYRIFREKTLNQRLATINAELQMLDRPSCKHPEYMRQVACLDARIAKQTSEADAWYKHKSQALRRVTLAQRSQYFSQYTQTVRQHREDVIDKLGNDWYDVQQERRYDPQEDDKAHTFKFPAKKSEQIRQQEKYNVEVSVLSGVAKYVGFPAAPEISGVLNNAAEDDLKAMRIPRRTLAVPQPAPDHSHTVHIPQRATFGHQQEDQAAHAQFLEQTPWARPQGPIYLHGTPNLTHTPNWAAEPATHGTNHMNRHLGLGIPHVASPYATPMLQRQQLPDGGTPNAGPAPLNSDPMEPPSSILAAPPTTDRIVHHHHYHAHPPAAEQQHSSPLMLPKQRQNGGSAGELTGFRNISNISGTSTIDAPPDSAERLRDGPPPPLPAQENHGGGPLQQHQYGLGGANSYHERKYANGGFRAHEGPAFGGTPVANRGPP